MKGLKRFALVIAVALLSVCAVVLAGCDKGEKKTYSTGVPESYADKVTLIIDDPDTETVDAYFQVDYSEFTAESTAFDLLEKLKEDGKMCFIGEDSSYGAFLKAAGVMENGEEKYLIEADDAAQVFIAIYTNVEKDKMGPNSIEFGSATVETSGFGISQMSLENGAVICLTAESWA